jgi:hypothetical protein
MTLELQNEVDAERIDKLLAEFEGREKGEYYMYSGLFDLRPIENKEAPCMHIDTITITITT